jgi:hypothetical protein
VTTEALEATRYLLGRRASAQRRVRAVTMACGVGAAALTVAFGVLLAAVGPTESGSAEHAHGESDDSDPPAMHSQGHSPHAGMEMGAAGERPGESPPTPSEQPAAQGHTHTHTGG